VRSFHAGFRQQDALRIALWSEASHIARQLAASSRSRDEVGFIRFQPGKAFDAL